MAHRRLVHAAWLLLLAQAECVNVALMCVSSPLTTTKVAIIESLLHTSPYRVILAFDVHNTVAREIQAAFPPPRAYDLLPLSYLKLAKEFGNKIDNFGGSRMHNPARLGALYWFSVSEYSLMWMFEDDTWSPDYGKFMAPYDQGDNQTEKWAQTADIVAHPQLRGPTLPLWFWKGWRVGDPNHGVLRKGGPIRARAPPMP